MKSLSVAHFAENFRKLVLAMIIKANQDQRFRIGLCIATNLVIMIFRLVAEPNKKL